MEFNINLNYNNFHVNAIKMQLSIWKHSVHTYFKYIISVISMQFY